MKLQNTLTFTCLGGGGVTLRAQVLLFWFWSPSRKLRSVR